MTSKYVFTVLQRLMQLRPCDLQPPWQPAFFLFPGLDWFSLRMMRPEACLRALTSLSLLWCLCHVLWNSKHTCHVGRGLLRARQEVRTTHPWEPFGEATISLVHFKSVVINPPLPSPSVLLSVPPVVETLNLVSHALSKCPTLSCIPRPIFFFSF